MQNLENIIKTADDDYLIGIANKGIVKRAYKDLEGADISAEYDDNFVTVSVSGEKCTIVSPLGDSKCTCPSRSVCRHIITSILWLRNNSKANNTDTNSEGSENVSISEELKEELSKFPINKLQLAMKKQYYTSFISKAERGKFPQLSETSIITGNIPDENVNVRLLSPLEYSTCSCHSKELCKHKASVILTWQLQNNIVSLNDIKIKDENSIKIDIDMVHDTAKSVKGFLYDILSNGLVRTSEDISEYAESMAVMCHNAHIASAERLMREIGNRLNSYVQHSSNFSPKTLFSIIMDTLILLHKIENTNDEKVLSKYIGEFKNTYVLSDTLELIPLSQRHFSSASGYEGDIYYFLNRDTNSDNKILSYSNVKPTFYGNTRRTYNAPWGLYGTLDEILGSEIRLKNPKLFHNKISSSNDTTAEIIGKSDLNSKIVYDNIYIDYQKMVQDTFGERDNTSEEHPVLIAINNCLSSEFDEINQTQEIVIEDYYNNFLTIKYKYTAENKDFFKSVQNVGEIMKRSNKEYVIFANAYLENGRCYLFPIAIFDHINYSKAKKNEIKTLEISENNNIEYGHFIRLFYDILKMMCDIIQCGVNSFDLYEQVFDYSQKCTKSGLMILGEKMLELHKMLTNKNHTYNTDNSKIILLLTEIYHYISVGLDKTEIYQAISNLKHI